MLKGEYSVCYLELNSPSANGKGHIPRQRTMYKTAPYRACMFIWDFQAGFLKRLN